MPLLLVGIKRAVNAKDMQLMNKQFGKLDNQLGFSSGEMFFRYNNKHLQEKNQEIIPPPYVCVVCYMCVCMYVCVDMCTCV